jgi:hypothetical protein
MYVSSTDPIPQNSMSPLPPGPAADYDARKTRTLTAAALAAANYACSTPVSAFSGQGRNFQYQVMRAINLLNHINTGLTAPTAQRKVTSTGTGGAPKVIPLNPVDTNPKPKPVVPQQGPFDAPVWGDADIQWPGTCTPGASILQWVQQNPWWAVGGVAAVALASGLLGSQGRRRAA